MSIEHSPARQGKELSVGNVGRLLVSDAELAEILGVSRTTIWRRAKDGTLPRPLKFGGLTRFVLSEVLAHVEAAKAARDGEAGLT